MQLVAHKNVILTAKAAKMQLVVHKNVRLTAKTAENLSDLLPVFRR